ncbi:uncharacterized protein LOC120629400 isoform X1 [Pararge aegeria]|uniref:uncharacterized protein LOC120629400 isoform X1 n=1 Tax=Pararge aegeria TaxID=116150 RepID=UPI0019D13114|nr:uncharacterized protein LOC120629400 isoform X1 [Pararge aegeria]
MINILSYIGMNLQSEVCLWTLLGLLRTIFDATLFKVNANLKQVWQMKMPPEMSLPVQRALRTMISGVMLAQCFTVYVYLASYIVLLYPVFLEERPTLVLPWLLLAAIRNLLCELTSLALGLGTCVLLGPARPPCIRFVIIKLASIMPAFYMWMLNFGYYHNLKMASAFKTFPAVLPAKDLDYGLELAVRRRRTKSLQGEDQLRKKLIASLYAEQVLLTDKIMTPVLSCIKESKQSLPIVSQVTSNADITSALDTLCPMSVTSNRTMSDIGTYEDWFGSEVVVPRDTDRILEQFVLMLMRIGAYLKKENVESIRHLNSHSQAVLLRHKQVECTAMPSEETDTPPLVGNTKGGTASYLRDYPQIFGKKTDILSTLNTSELAEVKSSSSSQSAKSTKGVSTETVEVKFKNLTIQESRDMFTYLQDKNNVDDVSEQIDNEQFLNNLKVDSGDKDEVGNNKTINEIRDSTEPNQSENKNKFKTSERILNLNKYKRKESK